ncbi:hypothetical protein BKA93DRAFT_107436 [Sparassis latifolia]
MLFPIPRVRPQIRTSSDIVLECPYIPPQVSSRKSMLIIVYVKDYTSIIISMLFLELAAPDIQPIGHVVREARWKAPIETRDAYHGPTFTPSELCAWIHCWSPGIVLSSDDSFAPPAPSSDNHDVLGGPYWSYYPGPMEASELVQTQRYNVPDTCGFLYDGSYYTIVAVGPQSIYPRSGDGQMCPGANNGLTLLTMNILCRTPCILQANWVHI